MSRRNPSKEGPGIRVSDPLPPESGTSAKPAGCLRVFAVAAILGLGGSALVYSFHRLSEENAAREARQRAEILARQEKEASRRREWEAAGREARRNAWKENGSIAIAVGSRRDGSGNNIYGVAGEFSFVTRPDALAQCSGAAGYNQCYALPDIETKNRPTCAGVGVDYLKLPSGAQKTPKEKLIGYALEIRETPEEAGKAIRDACRAAQRAMPSGRKSFLQLHALIRRLICLGFLLSR